MKLLALLMDWFFKRTPASQSAPVQPTVPVQPPVVVPPAPIPTKLPTLAEVANQDILVAWDNPVNIRHNVRVLCDQAGLSLNEKNIITACIEQESGFMNSAKNQNRDKTTGQVWSTDWGICQINDYYHCGSGKDFPSSDYVVAHPDEAVKFMIRMYKAGQLKQWVSFSSGAYLRYMPK